MNPAISSLAVAACLAMAASAASTAPAVVEKITFTPGQTFRDCPDCTQMMVIPAGRFIMGSPASEPGFFEIEAPQHSVSLRQFAIGTVTVTRGQWAAFVAATKRIIPEGCSWTPTPEGNPHASWKNLGFAQDDTHPVVCVTWNDAQDYAKWMSERTGRAYRLPTEAEWEYAARAGSATAYPWGPLASHEHANYGADKCCGPLTLGRDRWINTSPVGSFPPNAFGLYDMNGNVLQWVEDCFAASYAGLPADGKAYETRETLKLTGELKDLSGQSSCAFRMLRGGNWGDPPEMVRSAFRNFAPAPGDTIETYRSSGVGFRLAATLD